MQNPCERQGASRRFGSVSYRRLAPCRSPHSRFALEITTPILPNQRSPEHYESVNMFDSYNKRHKKKHSADDAGQGMDMTPMVDVTFLLLIFFMVTASFVTIRSIETPASLTDEVSTRDQLKDETEFIECSIDRFDTYHITSHGVERQEAASDLEMQQLLRQMIADHAPKRLIIKAHENSSLKKSVAVYSAGRVLGVQEIQQQTTHLDF